MKSEEEREREGGGLIEVKGPYGSTRRLTCATTAAADVEEEAAAVPVASLTATVTTAADVEEDAAAAVPVASLTATTTVTTAARSEERRVGKECCR